MVGCGGSFRAGGDAEHLSILAGNDTGCRELLEV